MKKNKKTIFAGMITIFLLGARFGYWFSPDVTVQCGHDHKYINSQINEINDQTDRWLSMLDKELGNE